MLHEDWVLAGDLCKGLGKRYNNGEFADFELRCGGQVFKVHKVVIASQSEVLYKACSGPFKEASQGFMDLPDDNPIYLNALLHGIYTCDYDDEQELSLLFNSNVYMIADKYAVHSVKEVAIQKIQDYLYENENESLGHNLVPSFLTEVADAINFIYTNTPNSDNLRTAIAKYVAYKSNYLFQSTIFQKLVDCTTEIPEFGNDLARITLQALARDTYKCVDCGRQFAVTGARVDYCTACAGKVEQVRDTSNPRSSKKVA